MTDTQTAPISVTASGTKVASRETVKMLVAGAFAYAASQLVRSEVALVAIVPIGGFLGIWAYGVIERLDHWRQAKHMANKLPDEDAVVGHVK